MVFKTDNGYKELGRDHQGIARYDTSLQMDAGTSIEYETMRKEIKIQRAIELLKAEGYTITPPSSSLPVATQPTTLISVDPMDGYPLREALDLWLKYKKERGQTYKSIGLKGCMKKLLDLSGGNPDYAMEIVESSIGNNYAGLVPPKNNTRYGKPTKFEAIQRVAATETANARGEAARMGNEILRPF